MELAQEGLEQQLPDRDPSDRALQELGAAQLDRIEDPVLRRSFLWTQTILQYWYTRYGGRNDIDVGVSVGLLRSMNGDTRETGQFGIHRLVKSGDAPLNDTIEVDGIAFPVVTERGRFIPNAQSPPTPLLGRSACWVDMSAGPTGFRYGVLTCKHVLNGLALNAALPLRYPGNGGVVDSVVADLTADTIDAAILAVDKVNWPSGLRPMRIEERATAGMQVYFVDAKGKTRSSMVLRVEGLVGYYGNMASHRIYMDHHGAPGDSGALVTDDTGEEGIGLYMGTVLLETGKTLGVNQSLIQVTKYFMVTPMC